MEPLSLGASSFTPQQVLDVWQTHKKARSRMIPSSQFHCEGIKKINGELKIYMATSILDFKPDNHIPIEDFCIDLFKRALQTDNHFISLDDLLSKLVECSFRIDDDTSYPDHVATQRAIDLLIRLPAFPPPISTAGLDFRHFNPGYTNTTTSYDTEEARPDTSAGIDWADLNTVSSVSKIIIAMALIISYGGREVPRPANLRRLIDTLAGLLKTASQMSDKAEGHESTNAWYVLRSYLWTCWQRASMLYFWHLLSGQLDRGYDFELNQELAIDGASIAPELLAKFSSHDSRKSEYMCTWAYEALKAERGAATLDFRRFHDRFARCFSHKGARCRNGEPCNGRSPGNCKRFKGAEILDQSAHDYLCPGPTKCTKLHWDEASYRSITRARAVSIEATGDNLLRYCSASAQTMSVSHVWSHGQGGRPEKKTRDGQTGGMNICLHKRFASIAKEKFGCESYWMDTPCIPEDHALRRESIACINDIFTTSKATLVCDIDLMDIDISSIMQEGTTASTIEIQESILATLLVCDWNVRAWTLLEAFRGRKNIYILCKHNAVISLKQILDSVCRHGSIDIATLYLTAQHLIPSLIHPPNSGRSHHPISLGFISLEEAGSLLSHRHASRDSDDIVIWSLLFSGKACHSAEAMWRSKIPGQELENLDINTGFLVSSAPRITGHPGLSWAPSCPAVHLTDEQERDGLTAYLAFDGGGTSLASVAPFGLEAAWLIHRFPGGKSETAQTWPGLAAIVDKNLSDYLWGALLRPMAMNRWGETEPEKYRGNARGSLLVVCGSDDQNGAFWEWKGVWDWAGNPLPEFRKELVLIA